MTTISAWLIAQTIKVVIGVLRKKKFDFRLFIGSGGMPSAHAAGASCLATSIGMDCGFDSVYFALAFAFAIVVMFDAQGVRRSTGKQAGILNKIMDDILNSENSTFLKDVAIVSFEERKFDVSN